MKVVFPPAWSFVLAQPWYEKLQAIDDDTDIIDELTV